MGKDFNECLVTKEVVSCSNNEPLSTTEKDSLTMSYNEVQEEADSDIIPQSESSNTCAICFEPYQLGDKFRGLVMILVNTYFILNVYKNGLKLMKNVRIVDTIIVEKRMKI